MIEDTRVFSFDLLKILEGGSSTTPSSSSEISFRCPFAVEDEHELNRLSEAIRRSTTSQTGPKPRNPTKAMTRSSSDCQLSLEILLKGMKNLNENQRQDLRNPFIFLQYWLVFVKRVLKHIIVNLLLTSQANLINTQISSVFVKQQFPPFMCLLVSWRKRFSWSKSRRGLAGVQSFNIRRSPGNKSHHTSSSNNSEMVLLFSK